MEKFTKYNNSNYSDSLQKELQGLRLLADNLEHNSYINIPRIFEWDDNKLVLEKIDNSYQKKELSQQLGIGLAKLHQKKFDSYGLKKDNYIGLNPQKNTLSQNWGEFFITYRLLFQIKLIKDKTIQKEFLDILDTYSKKLEVFLNNSCKHPSLVHGDLWSGNVLYTTEQVYLIDPAVYYGDREVDIAMTEMFGGFDSEFYKAYNETFPLSDHYEKKKIIYNLYHYLNHYNLFGSSYLNSCEEGFYFIKTL